MGLLLKQFKMGTVEEEAEPVPPEIFRMAVMVLLQQYQDLQ
jgi:hypothetical protein